MKTVFAIVASLLLASQSQAACPFGHNNSNNNEDDSAASVRDVFAPPPEDSVKGFADEKMERTRAKIAATVGKAGPWPTTPQLLSMFLEDMSVTEDLVSDEFHDKGHGKRKKLIHSSGAIAEVKVNWTPRSFDTYYTGMFDTDLQNGFIRLSSAIEPDYTNPDSEAADFTPGMGMKFFRDNAPSANLFALAKLTPASSWNFFKNPLSNHLPSHDLPAKQTALVKKFSTAPSDWAGFTGLSSFARFDPSGREFYDTNLEFPFQLIFYANETLQAQIPDVGTGYDLFKTQLMHLPAGQHLYSIYSKDTRTTPEEHIGDVYTTTNFVESEYADTEMFLQHTRFEDDINLRADFLDGCRGIDECEVCPTETKC